MRRRRQSQTNLHNRERWLVSYADFITLLFAFFLVMYSVSSVNEGKYKVLSETLTGVFNVPQRSVNPVDTGESSRPLAVDGEQVIVLTANAATVSPRPQEVTRFNRVEALQVMADELALEFDSLIGKGVVTIESSEQWLELSLRDSLLFSSGDAEPHYDALQVIEKIAGVLKGKDNAIRVEGFTDNLPIRTSTFPSNWELSSARASAVVRMLARSGIAPGRMAAVGYGEYQPVARNDTVEGRRRNRRVVLLVSRDAVVRSSSGGQPASH